MTDAKARGALVGLTLAHKRGDIWRAMLEAICFGTRAAIEAMQKVGLGAGDEMLMTGGATRSPIFTQMHADITGKTVIIGETDNAVLLGAAVLARAGSSMEGKEGSGATSKDILEHVKRAVADMVRERTRMTPDLKNHARYTAIYRVYQLLTKAIRETNHVLANDYYPVSSVMTSRHLWQSFTSLYIKPTRRGVLGNFMSFLPFWRGISGICRLKQSYERKMAVSTCTWTFAMVETSRTVL